MYSNKIATFETQNAAVWEKDSEIGDIEEVPTTSASGVQITSFAVQRGLSRFSPAARGDNIGGRGRGRGTNNNARGRDRVIDSGSGSNGSHRGGGAARGNSRGNVGRDGHHTAATGRRKEQLVERTSLGGRSRDGTGLSHIPSVKHRADQELPRRPTVRVREPGLNSSTGWAEPTPLLTDARRAQLQYERESQANTKRFLKKPLDGEVFSAIGFYQWPMQEDSPEDLFREYLKDLDYLKTNWKVFIDWNGPRKWLRIRASDQSCQTAINEVIKGIRQAVESGKARAIMATPCHIVVPPRYSTESTLLEALVKVNGQKYVHGLKFSKQASDEELKKQSPSRSLKVEVTVEKFREELSKSLSGLSHLKDWMRMRVHFGEFHLTHWQTDLTDGKQTLDGFIKMMKRTRTRGTFEKGIDPLIVKYMMDRVKLNPDNFKVWSGTDYVLADVKPKHVAIFIVQNPSGERFHIEGDVDKTDGGYQCGEVKVIEEERRNKCVEIVTIDIEQVDWNLEIISETAGTMLDSSFQDLVQSCLQPFVRTGLNTQGLEERKDQYDFIYPRIAPYDQPGLRVDKVTLQSVYRFKTRAGGYCLEFTINRDWDGLRTKPEPNVSAGITMFHDQWDVDMESNEHTMADRKWEKDMSNFFPDGGFKVFMEQLDYLLDGFHQSKSKSISTA
ncbi:predicted protein [Sclerotinia sclerotiorum 1980 UF-70]|uniref:DUF7905 domain-containing protein n=2 Tax=Sclerotinia sclerotiorum (strain ATCC 18683 / 1980 / Ss-1) TaxID=665079 RepID=A7ENL3_SCLS1|nr:predicted protein [Sclerotinia sclerotiorum 1980 UF-70]APA14861.1 hypothetical protein sscle_13g096310 [Sclerotinia sclerotiorum 1980 UF-70]EDO04429.1 predicted protein [Sclerotinia sclerotiorum 1980 UF-70]